MYNSSRFIKGCLEDLIAQTLYRKGQLEIVVVNTGSPQNEDPIIREFAKKHRNVKYIRTDQRETVYQAWNRGVKAAEGEYITNANTDDRHRRDALEVLANELDRSPNVALVYADSLITDKMNDTFATHKPNLVLNYPEYDRNTLRKWCCIGPQPMWRRSLHDEFGYFSETYRIAGDYEFWLRISEKYPFRHIKQYLGLFCKTENNLEFQNMELSHRETFEIQEHYLNLAPGTANEYIDRIETAVRSGDLTTANTVSSIGVLKHVNSPLMWLSRARVLRITGKPTEALDAISVAIKIEESMDALYELIKIHDANGRPDHSENVRKYIRQQYPEVLH